MANLFSNIVKDFRHHTIDVAKSGIKERVAKIGSAVKSVAPSTYKDSGFSRFIDKYSGDSKFTRNEARRREKKEQLDSSAIKSATIVQTDTMSEGFSKLAKLQVKTLDSLEKIRKAVMISGGDNGLLGKFFPGFGGKLFGRGAGKVATGVAGTALATGAAGAALTGAAAKGATTTGAKGFNAFSKTATGIAETAAKTATLAVPAGAEVAGKSSGAIAKILGKGALKGAGKTLLKGLPIVGALAGIGFGIHRLMKGDMVGAGLEFASGIAGGFLPPGAGLATVAALETAIVARDVMKAKEGEAPSKDEAQAEVKAEATVEKAPETKEKSKSSFNLGPKEAYAGDTEATKDLEWNKKHGIDTGKDEDAEALRLKWEEKNHKLALKQAKDISNLTQTTDERLPEKSVWDKIFGWLPGGGGSKGSSSENGYDVDTTGVEGKSHRDATAAVTAEVEGGNKSYSAVNTNDGTTISAGKYQFNAKSSLSHVLDRYSENGGVRSEEAKKFAAQMKAANKLPEKERNAALGQLKADKGLHSFLGSTGNEPAMQKAQEKTYDTDFYNPAMAEVKSRGFDPSKFPRLAAMAVDTNIQGGLVEVFNSLKEKYSNVSGMSDAEATAKFAELRKQRLVGLNLGNTTDRVDKFAKKTSGISSPVSPNVAKTAEAVPATEPTKKSTFDKVTGLIGPKEAHAAAGDLNATKDPNWYKKHPQVAPSTAPSTVPKTVEKKAVVQPQAAAAGAKPKADMRDMYNSANGITKKRDLEAEKKPGRLQRIYDATVGQVITIGATDKSTAYDSNAIEGEAYASANTPINQEYLDRVAAEQGKHTDTTNAIVGDYKAPKRKRDFSAFAKISKLTGLDREEEFAAGIRKVETPEERKIFTDADIPEDATSEERTALQEEHARRNIQDTALIKQSNVTTDLVASQEKSEAERTGGSRPETGLNAQYLTTEDIQRDSEVQRSPSAFGSVANPTADDNNTVNKIDTETPLVQPSVQPGILEGGWNTIKNTGKGLATGVSDYVKETSGNAWSDMKNIGQDAKFAYQEIAPKSLGGKTPKELEIARQVQNAERLADNAAREDSKAVSAERISRFASGADSKLTAKRFSEIEPVRRDSLEQPIYRDKEKSMTPTETMAKATGGSSGGSHTALPRLSTDGMFLVEDGGLNLIILGVC